MREARIRLQITGLGRGMQLDAVIIGAMMAGLEDWRLGLGDSAESILEDKSSEMCLAGQHGCTGLGYVYVDGKIYAKKTEM